MHVHVVYLVAVMLCYDRYTRDHNRHDFSNPFMNIIETFDDIEHNR